MNCLILVVQVTEDLANKVLLVLLYFCYYYFYLGSCCFHLLKNLLLIKLKEIKFD